MKTCNKCLIEKELVKFNKDPRNKDGLQGICIDCRRDAKQKSRLKRIIEGPDKIVTNKTCNTCNITKSVSDFYKDAGIADGYRTTCKTCKDINVKTWREAKREEYNAYARKYRKTHPAKYEQERNRGLKNRYGLTIQHYNEMLLKQNGTCALCDYKPNGKPLYVDHDHATGKVRGLLCPSHNRSLALLDEAGLLDKALIYVKK